MSDIVEPKNRIERAWDFVKRVRGYMDGSRIGFASEDLASAKRAAALEGVSLGDAGTAYSDQLIVPLYEATAQALGRLEVAEERLRQLRTYDGTALTTASVSFTAEEPVLALELGPLSYAEAVVETGERTVPLRLSTAGPKSLRFEGALNSISLHCLDSLDGLPTENDVRKPVEVTPGWRLLEWFGTPAQLLSIHRVPIQDGGLLIVSHESGASVFTWGSRASEARVSLFRSVGKVSLPGNEPIPWSKWHQARAASTSFLFAMKRRGIRTTV
jgi:hypothetical protein